MKKRKSVKFEIIQKSDHINEKPMSYQKGLSLVWPITKDVWSFYLKGKNVQQRLQRDVVHLIRRKG